jgi:DNA primase
VDANKDLFYCYGCGRGGDVIRFAELYHQVKFPQAVLLLLQWRGVGPVLQEAYVSIALSYTGIVRRMRIYANAESARRR